MKTLKSILIYILCTYGGPIYAKTFNLDYGMQFSASGYVGWRQILSNVDYDSVPSEPELGLITSLKVTDRLNIFNQFKWGESIDEILVYNQINYDLDTHIDGLQVILRGGRLLHNTFLYNSTRVNPRTRQGVISPQSMAWNTLGLATTSGTGIGTDIKYKNFSISYLIDKTTVVHPNSEAEAWFNLPGASELKTKFNNHTITMGYELPEYGIRTKLWAEKLNYTAKYNNNLFNFSGELVGGGLEWNHSPIITSAEFMCAKSDSSRWSHWNSLNCGISTTLEYDINANWTARINYNQYRSAIDQQAPPVARYSRDLNIGINWHYGNYMIGAEGHYVRGGRIVDTQNVFNNPQEYDHFYVIGLNAVYFFE